MAQHLITALVPTGVVDFLEVIQVNHQHGQAGFCALRLVDGFVQRHQKRPAVEHAGERVDFCQVAQLVGDELIGQHQGAKSHEHQRHNEFEQNKLGQQRHQLHIRWLHRAQFEQQRPQQQKHAMQACHQGHQIAHGHLLALAGGQRARSQQKENTVAQARQHEAHLQIRMNHREIQVQPDQGRNENGGMAQRHQPPARMGNAAQKVQTGPPQHGALGQQHGQGLRQMVAHQKTEAS